MAGFVIVIVFVVVVVFCGLFVADDNVGGSFVACFISVFVGVGTFDLINSVT